MNVSKTGRIRVTALWALALAAAANSPRGHAAETLALHLSDAEAGALAHSPQLRSANADAEAASEQESALFAPLLPRLSLQGSYLYQANIPSATFPAPINLSLPFGQASSYSIGPTLGYTLWDTLSSLKAYHAASRSSEARREDLKSARIQLLLSVREAYTQVQLGLEELALISDSRALARAQDRDVANRYRAGAAATLDVVTSQRAVLGYEIQFQQRQALLSSELKDLLALLGQDTLADTTKPGPAGLEHVTLELRFDRLRELLAEDPGAGIQPPGDAQPRLRSAELQASALELQADSQRAKLLPTLQIGAQATVGLPNIPFAKVMEQASFTANISMPLWLGDPTWHQASAEKLQAESATDRRDQLKLDLTRDFGKARELLSSLREQRELAARDVKESEQAARLYYVSYKAGKINLIDVQNANVQALGAKVSAARIDAQILEQLAMLRALSGDDRASAALLRSDSKEPSHD
jgi:outer membrane protein TolC